MAKRSHRKGHGTGIKDYRAYEEMTRLPMRESLAPGKKGPTTRFLTGPGISIPITTDDRSETEKAAQDAWDERMKEILKARDDRGKAKKEAAIRQVRKIARGEGTTPGTEPTPGTGPTETAEGTTTDTTTSGGPVNPGSGTRQKKEGVRQAKPAPLNPRKIVATTDVSTRNLGGGDAASDTQVDGLSDRNQTDVVSHLTGTARNKAAVLDIQANDARKDALQESRIRDEERRRDEIRRKAEQGDETKKYWADREEKRKAAADAAYADRMERRYQEGKLSSMDDWRNLGREGSNRRNYAAVEGETDAQKKERETALAERNDRIKGLQQKAARMADRTLLRKGEELTWDKDGNRLVTRAATDAEREQQGLEAGTRIKVSEAELKSRKSTGVGDDGYTYAADSFYASNPNKMKYLENLRKAFEESVAKKTLTDKQIDAFEAKLNAWENEGKSNRAKIDAANAERVAMKNMELRQKYGFTDVDPRTGQYLMSDTELGAYHKGKQAEAVKKTLGEMAQRGFVDTEEGYRDYGKSWRTLMENGISLPEAVADAVKGMTPEQRKAYNDQLAAATSPEAEDTIRQNAALNYLYKVHSIDTSGGAEGQGFVAGHDVARMNSKALSDYNEGNLGNEVRPVGSTSELTSKDILVPRGLESSAREMRGEPEQGASAQDWIKYMGSPVASASKAPPQQPVQVPAPAEGQSLTDVLKKDKELTRQAYGGGYTPLRPRRFRG